MATKKTATKATAKAATSTATSTKGTKLPATKMTKTAVIRYMAEQMEVSPKQIGAFLSLLIETAVAQTRKQGEFTIPGLGKLVKAQRAARMGRNPATGEAIKIKAKTTVKFRLAKAARMPLCRPSPSGNIGRKLFRLSNLRPIRKILFGCSISAG